MPENCRPIADYPWNQKKKHFVHILKLPALQPPRPKARELMKYIIWVPELRSHYYSDMNVNVNLESQPRAPTKIDRCSCLSYYVHVYWEDFKFGNSGYLKNITLPNSDKSEFLTQNYKCTCYQVARQKNGCIISSNYLVIIASQIYLNNTFISIAPS